MSLRGTTRSAEVTTERHASTRYAYLADIKKILTQGRDERGGGSVGGRVHQGFYGAFLPLRRAVDEHVAPPGETDRIYVNAIENLK